MRKYNPIENTSNFIIMLIKDKRFLNIFLLVSLFVFRISDSHAQLFNFNCQNYTVKDGLPSKAITGIVQDAQGYIWISTENGASRFDGNQFVNYWQNPINSISISSNFIATSFADHNGSVYFIYLTNFIDRYDPYSNQFIHYKVDISDPGNEILIHHIEEDNNGKIWCASNKGLWYLDHEKQSIVKYEYNHPFRNYEYKKFDVDTSNRLWIALESSGLLVINTNTGETEHIIQNNKITGEPFIFQSIFIDSENIVWLKSDSEIGFYNYNKKKYTTKLIADIVRCGNIIEDSDKNILFAADGIYYYNRSDDGFIKYEHDVTGKNPLASNEITTLFLDKQQTLWIGHYNDGLDRCLYNHIKEFSYYKKNENEQNSLVDNRITCLESNGTDYIWIGTSLGLDLFNRETKQYKHYLKNKTISSIFEDKYGMLWAVIRGEFGHNKSVSSQIYTKSRTDAGFRLYENPILSADIVYRFVEDYDSNLWAVSRTGLYRINQKTKQIAHYPHKEVLPIGAVIHSCIIDKNGTFWMCSSHGLIRTNPWLDLWSIHNLADELYNNTFSDNIVSQAYIDKNDIMWITTDSGMMICKNYMENELIFERITVAQGLPDNLITGILEDSNQNLWIGTGFGLARYDKNNKILRTYNRFDGIVNTIPGYLFIKECDYFPVFKTINGEFIFGGEKGFNLFCPDSINNNDYIPPIYLSDFQIFNTSVPIGEYRDNGLNFEKDIRQAARLNLSYKDSVFSFEFVALDYANPLIILNDGLVLHLPFEGNLNDAVGDNDGYINYDYATNEMKYKSKGGIVGQYGHFDYTLVNVDGFEEIDWDNGASFSIQFWMRDFEHSHSVIVGRDQSSLAVDKRSVHWWVGTLTGGHAAWWLRDNNFIPGPELQSPQSVGLNEWHLITAVRNGAENMELLYVDNELVASDTFTYAGHFKATDPLNIGYLEWQDNPGVWHYSGDVDEIRIYNRALTAEDVLLRYNADMGMVSDKYAYILKGFETSWNYVNANYRKATYTNIPAGDYTFVVKTVNPEGVRNKQGLSVNIHIAPPFWRTLWFRIPLGIIIICLIIGYNYFRHYVIRKRNKMLESTIQLRTAELQKKSEALQRSNKILEKQKLELERLNKDIELANQAKVRFFTNISHEFRTPLTLIKGPLENILSNGKHEREWLKNQVLISLHYTNRLNLLINQLLDFQKVDSGNMPLYLRNKEIVRFVHEIFNSFSQLAERMNIEYNFIAGIDSIHMWFDADKIDKIITNLLSNAFKFTPEGGKISLKLDVTKNAKEVNRSNSRVDSKDSSRSLSANIRNSSNYLQISVTDTGVGIEEDKLNSIFERFYSIPESNGQNHEGSGIGLAFTKDLVELHKGTIHVKSKVLKSIDESTQTRIHNTVHQNSGTTFTILLPLDKTVFNESDFVYPDQDITGMVLKNKYIQKDMMMLSSRARSNKRPDDVKYVPRLLIVEDHVDLRKYIVDILQDNYYIEEAENGKIGLAKTRTTDFDLIISDIMMPEIDGIDFCKRIKTNFDTSHIPVILLTAKSTDESEIEGIDAGADDYIKKPFNHKVLLSHVQNLILSRIKLKEKFSNHINFNPKNFSLTETDEKFLKKAVEIIEKNLLNPDFNISFISNKMYLSQKTLNRKIRNLTNLSTINFIISIRLKKAATLILKKELNISEIAYEVGFSDPAYFTKRFKKQFSVKPSDYLEYISSKPMNK